MAEDVYKPEGFCPHCGYRMSAGRCPECGSDVSARNLAKIHPTRRRRRRLLIAAAIIIPIGPLLGYVRATTAWVCPNCAEHEFRTIHIFRLPFGGPELFRLQGRIREGWQRPDPLTPYLDPEGNCQHQWRGFGWSGEGLLDGWRGIGLDPALNSVASEPDFGHFVADHPDVLDRIRKSIRKRVAIKAWLYEEYMDWKDEPSCDEQDSGGN